MRVVTGNSDWSNLATDNKHFSIINTFEIVEKEVSNRMNNSQKLLQGVQEAEKLSLDLKLKKEAYGIFLTGQLNRKLRKPEEGIETANFKEVIGIVSRKEALLLKRLIFRVTKGNSFMLFEDFSHEQEDHQLFVLWFRDSDILKSKIGRIMENFKVMELDVPSERSILQAKHQQICKEVADNETLLRLTKEKLEEHITELLNEVYQDSPSLLVILKALNEVFHELFSTGSKFRPEKSIIVAYAWVQSSKLEGMKAHMQRSHVCELRELDLKANPPTYFATNEFTEAFQLIVNTYGTPRYKEVNPGLFAIVLFPFLFGVMFGDAGHGGLLFLFGIFLLNAGNVEALAGFAKARYLLVFLGGFAFYCGFVYNEFFSIPMEIFGSCYPVHGVISKHHSIKKASDCNYKFGIDPIWAVSSNELSFVNSLKMKISVLIGVTQMVFGSICSK